MIQIECIKEFKDEIINYSNIGKDLSATKSIAFLSLARDCENGLEDRLKTIDLIGSSFAKYGWFVYENDSKDNTKKVLQKACSNNKFLISEKLNATHPVGPLSKSRARTEALARYRNILKKEAKTKFDQYDYICVIDMDFDGLYEKAIYNSIYWMDYNQQIDAMAGVTIEIHQKNRLSNYDSWAYRHTWWSDQQHTMIWFYNWVPIIGSHPYKVNSAFGGSCIYKSKFYFGDCDYEGYDCEHVCFHKNLYSKYKNFSLYINPSQVLVVQNAKNNQRK